MALRGRGTTLTARPALISSAARIKLATNGAGVKLPKTAGWQTEALQFRTDVPEIGFASLFVGQTLAKVRVYVGYRRDGADPNEAPIPVDAEDSECPPAVAAAALAELGRLRSGRPTMAAFIYRYAILIDLTGDCYLVGTEATETEPESWSIRSVSEIRSDGSDTYVTDYPGDKGRKLIPGVDALIRLFQADAEWSGVAWSPMRHLLTDCRILQVLRQQLYAETISRLSAGILLVADTLSPPPQVPEGDDPADDPFMEALMEVLTTPIEDPSSAASVVPSVIRGQLADIKDGVRHLTFDRGGSIDLDARITKRVESLARGINLPVEAVLGHMATTFANAEQINEDIYDDHLQPRLVALMEMLTQGFMQPQAMANPSIPDDWSSRLECWFDPAPLMSQADPGVSADKGLEELAISAETWRREKGFAESDAPSLAELFMRTIMKRGQMTQDVVNAMFRLLASTAEGEEPDLSALQMPITLRPVSDGLVLPAVDDADVVFAQTDGLIGEDGPIPPPGVAVGASASGGGGPGNRQGVTAATVITPSPLGARLARLDRDLRTRIQTAASAALARALERAGNRIRAKAPLRASVADIAAHLRAAHLGRPTLLAAGLTDAELLADAFTELFAQVSDWTGAVQTSALAELTETVRLTPSVVRHLAGQQAAALDVSSGWFSDALNHLAHQRLYEPGYGTIDPRGEDDLNGDVPVGLVRNYLTVAGKASTSDPTGLVTTEGEGAWVAVPGPSGIGQGDLIIGAYKDAGGKVDGYVWEHGFPRTPFHPHLELDGVPFADFEDPVLENFSGWPETRFFFGGDHFSCSCDYTIVLIDPPPPDG